MAEISIIMPCLNSIKYIGEALYSVRMQTFGDLELIVVDAGSTDGTLELLQEYASLDPRIHILHSDVRSMGYQYNMGLDAAQGRYIGFVESDDYIAIDMFETLHKAMVEHDPDYVKSNFDMFADFADLRVFLPYGPVAANCEDVYDRLIGPMDISRLVLRDGFMWNGLYKKKFLIRNKIRLNETPKAAFQDAGFVAQAMLYAQTAYYIRPQLYYYRKDNADSSFFNIDTFQYTMAEFRFIYDVLGRESDCPGPVSPVLVRKYFGMFNYHLKKHLYKKGCSNELLYELADFQKLFAECYNSLSVLEKSWSELWPPQNLRLFLDDLEQFCNFTRRLAVSDAESHMALADVLRESPMIFIYGTNDAAGSLYCYLLRSGYGGFIGFCNSDANGDTRYMDRPVQSIDIASRYGAVFVIAPGAGARVKRAQLVSHGVAIERIFCGLASMDPHSCFDIPVRQGND